MTVEYLPISYQATLTKCPYCLSIVYITGKSNVTERSAITDVLVSTKDHLDNSCPIRKKNNKLIKTNIELQIKSREIKNGKSRVEYESHYIII